ncbi:MAG: hypothetical protein N2484_03085 [Clostridia bacterium]|nr:hypothetical protein [Clostridia bacterium]
MMNYSNILKISRIKYISLFAVLFILGVSICTYATDSGNTRQQEIKERTEKILNYSEFMEKEKDQTVLETMAVGVKEIVEAIKEKIKQIIERMKLPEIKASDFDHPLDAATSATLKFVGIIIIAAFVLLIGYLVSRNFRVSRLVRMEEDAEILAALKDSDSIEMKAVELAQKGDYRQGIRFLYIALLLKYNEKNLIKIEKSKTNKQYLIELREGNFPSVDRVSAFTQDFNRFWYGNRKILKEQYEYWKSQYNLLKKEVEA